MTPQPLLRRSDLVRSVLIPYGKNAQGAWDRFLHVRIQKAGRSHPSPIDHRSRKDCTHV